MPYLLSLDEGTTSARAALYDRQGRRLAIASISVASAHPHSGWVEQDANAIWNAQLDSARQVLQKIHDSVTDIAAIGITNQRETTIVWDRRTGEPVAPAIVWQCRRTADYCADLAQSMYASTITAKTGLVIDAYFSGSKIRWILENVPGARAKAQDGHLLFGNVDSWLIWKLTGGKCHVTDVTNASRTLLMDLRSGQWDNELLRIFDVPRSMMPEIVPSSGVVGVTDPALFGSEIPIGGIAGDQQSALFGQACFQPGMVKNTYGTGCFALMHTGTRAPVSRHRLLGTKAAASPGAEPQFALEGSVFVAGAAMQWVRDKLGLIQNASDSDALARSVPDTGGVYFVPAFVGLGAPHWDANARGLLTGITASTGKAEIVRAALESIAFQSRELIEAMEADAGERLTEVRVDGGAAANDFLMQFQADILNVKIVRPSDIETTALGAAYLAGLAVGVFRDCAELEQFWAAEKVFEPQMPDSQRDALWTGWQSAVRRTVHSSAARV